MNYQAFKKIKAIENGYKKQLKETYPNLTEDSGIYCFTRVDNDTGIKYAYVGQAKHLLSRLAQHLAGRQSHIDRSLLKRGWGESGEWQLGWRYVPEPDVDDAERENIKAAANKSYQLLNRQSGGKNSGRTNLGESEGIGGYRKGKAAGEEKLRLKVKEYFDKYLDPVMKGKPNKLKERKLEEFKTFIGATVDND